MGELLYADIEKNKGNEIAGVLKKISATNFDGGNSEDFMAEKVLSVLGKKLYLELRGKGLCVLL